MKNNLLKELDYAALQQCMHCGMCLSTCPTYVQTYQEKNSPRGRIALMRAIKDGKLEVEEAFGEEMYYCLGCLACETACPAGVEYVKLFEAARGEVENQKVLGGIFRRFTRFLLLRGLFFSQGTLRLLGKLFYLYQAIGLQKIARNSGILKLLSKRLRELEKMTPTFSRNCSAQMIQEVETGRNKNGRTVALLTGCIQDVAFSQINRDTADVLLANGFSVQTPKSQGCCGSLHAHNGEIEWAKELARRNIDLFLGDSEKCEKNELSAIITNAAGCGSHLKHYGNLLKDDPIYAERAKRWDGLVKDIHEFLVGAGFKKPKDLTSLTAQDKKRQKLAYHEACHLCHGQKITKEPREILKSLTGYEFVELGESTWCCGSAGVYNITQPESAAQLLERKMKHIQASGADVVASANPGCILQIEHGCRSKADTRSVRVAHPITLLAEEYRVYLS